MRQRILVPLEILEGETVGPGVVDLLASTDVVLLGYHVIPEQTAPSQARMTFEEKAQAKLNDAAEALREAGATVETVLAFTPEREQTLDRVAADHDCDAVLHLNPVMEDENLLVVLHGDVDAERIGRFTAAFVDGRDVDVTVLEVTPPDEAATRTGVVTDALVDGGYPRQRLTREHVESTTPVKAIAEVATAFDAMVMGEKAPNLRALVFGDFEERVAAESIGAVFVVRREDRES
ncbi:universal stress protein [Haloarculaceae archaeon H-GB2-1]|nr:universal stress protein [Haloarculaceae archaeon H-GB1-1]MEA5386972.1 universal stress protein [Haloarculaceae archaeon H-GB11]MEA5408474.1 universal stress protein [Haloarculaceae archaeon H-GB2-1]